MTVTLSLTAAADIIEICRALIDAQAGRPDGARRNLKRLLMRAVLGYLRGPAD